VIKKKKKIPSLFFKFYFSYNFFCLFDLCWLAGLYHFIFFIFFLGDVRIQLLVSLIEIHVIRAKNFFFFFNHFCYN
jgi:hypothetical protein